MWRCRMPRTMTGGLISRGPDSLQLTRPVTCIFFFFTLITSSLPLKKIKKTRVFKHQHDSSPSSYDSGSNSGEESNSPEDDFLKFYLSCLVTSVGKHPGAVLLLNAQQPILVTFNEFPPPPHGAAMPDPFALVCGSEHIRSHLRTTQAEITGISALCFRYATSPAYVRGESDEQRLRTPQTAALAKLKCFCSCFHHGAPVAQQLFGARHTLWASSPSGGERLVKSCER